MGVGDKETRINKIEKGIKKTLIQDIEAFKTFDPYAANRRNAVARFLKEQPAAPMVPVSRSEAPGKPELQRDPDAVTLEQLAGRLKSDSLIASDFHSGARILDAKTDWKRAEEERRATLPPIDRLKRLQERLNKELDQIENKDTDSTYKDLLGALNGVEDAIKEAQNGNGTSQLMDPNEFVRRFREENPQPPLPEVRTYSMRLGRFGALAAAALSFAGLGGLVGGWKAKGVWEDLKSKTAKQRQENLSQNKDATLKKRWEEEKEYQKNHTLGVDQEPIFSNEGVSVSPIKHDPDVKFEKIAMDGYTYPLDSGATVRLPKPGSSVKFSPSGLGPDNRTSIELSDRDLPDGTSEPVFHIHSGGKDIERTFPKDPSQGFEPNVFRFEWNDKKGYLVKITPLPPDRYKRVAYTISIVEAKRDE